MNEELKIKILEYLTANSTSVGECIEWTGSLNSAGYGQIGDRAIELATKIKGAHRLAFAVENDFSFTSRNQQVMHSCHNRRCINTDHLSLGCARENLMQAAARGTIVRKLDTAKVIAMRAMRAAGLTYVVIGRMFEISETNARAAVVGETWSHIPQVDFKSLGALSWSVS